MRLRKFTLQSFGHFENVTIKLPGDRLQVIHGQNEAGKSTLLGFIRDILFGFGDPNSFNPYAIRATRLEGTCQFELANRTLFEFRRRRFRPEQLSKVVNGELEPITQLELQNVLGGANASLYRNIFAFGLKELTDGEKTLKDESVQNALHGSGLGGLAHPQKILDQFAKECEAIFKPGGRAARTDIAARLAEIKELREDLRLKVTKTETFLQRQREYDEESAAAEQFASQLAQARQELTRVRRIVKAFPLWQEVQELLQQRNQLGPLPRLDTQAGVLFRNSIEEANRIQAELSKIERDAKFAEADLVHHPEQTEWLSRREEIEKAREQIQSVQDSRRDLPLRQTELETLHKAVQQGIVDVISDWTTDDLQAFHCDARLLHQGEELARSKRELDQDRIRLDQRDVELRQQRTEVEAELEALGELEEIAALQALVDNHAEYVSIEKDIARLTKEQSKLERQMATQTRKLSPPLPSQVTDIASLPVPPETEILHFQHELESLAQQIKTAELSLAEAEAQCQHAQRELDLVRGSLATIPTRNELQRLRQHRDAGWSLIQQKYIANTDPDPAAAEWLAGQTEPVELLFANALMQTDTYADSLFDNASLVHKQEQVTSLQQVAEAKRKELEAQHARRAEFEMRWKNLWRQCGLEPLTPDTMLGWKAQHVALRDLINTTLTLTDELKQHTFRRDLLLSKLAAALPHETDDPEIRWSVARQRVERHGRQAQERKSHQKTLTRVEKNSQQLEKDRRDYEGRLATWQTAAAEWLARLEFPRDWQPDFALQVIARLQGLREKMSQIPSLQTRIAAMNARIQEFDPFVLKLCQSVAPEWTIQPTDIAARQLSDRLAKAVATDQRRRELELTIAQLRTRQEDLAEQLAATRTRRLELLQQAEVETDQAFFEVAERNDQLREWDRQIETKRQELARLRDFEDEAEFNTQLEQCHFVALSSQLEVLERQIAALEEQERGANERKGSAKRALDELDGSAAAAEIQTKMTQRRAAIANAVDRFVPLQFAQQLLQQTLQRFEKESQPAMLKEVSSLFSQMTGGRYLRVERPRDASRPLVVYRNDTDELEPDHLSTGTREQLFLAIRLAYVLHYCSRTEPLPIVLDDVLANFDPPRTRRTLETLGQLTDRIQVLLFTCHPHVVTLAQEVFPGLEPVEVPRNPVLVSG